MLTNMDVSTTLTLMIPVQTATVDEPDGSRERDLLAGSEPDSALSRIPCSLAESDDFGQPTPDPNPLTEPSWAQVCAMGYLIPGIGASPATWWPRSWTASTPRSPGSCSTNTPGS